MTTFTAYKPIEVTYGDEFLKILDSNFEQLTKIDKDAKARGELLGRYIAHPYADGRAYYQIVKVNKRTVKIKVLTGLGDDWVLPAWGEEATIDRNIAEAFVQRRDSLGALFSGKEH